MRSFCEEIGLEVFLPQFQSWRTWSDRRKRLNLPLFPSYVFVNVNETERLRAMRAPGFLWYVSNRLGPVRVEEHELTAVRALLSSGLEFDPLPEIQVGGPVEIVRGAMRGCRGFLERKGRGAIVIRVSAIGSAVRVQLPDPAWLRPLPAAALAS